MQVEIYPEHKQFDKNGVSSPSGVVTKLDKSINNIIKKEKFITYKIDKKSISTNGGNYLSVLYEIDIKGKTKEGDKELNIFVKNTIQSEKELTIISMPTAFKNELFAYKVLAKIFNELQDEVGVPFNERYRILRIFDESNTESIMIENLARRGFVTCHRMDVVSLKFAELAIKELAKFHALSFVLKETRPKFFETEIKSITAPNNYGNDMDDFTKCMVKMTMNYVDDNYKKKVEKYCVDIFDKLVRCVKDEKTKRCLCHGDYRANNIMSKIINGEVAEVIPVDYQLLNYGSPMLDFFYLIFTSTDREFRRAHLSNLKDLYFEYLTQFLKYFDIDINMAYPRKTFDEDYKEKLGFGLITSVLFLPLIFALENDLPDLLKDDVTSMSFKLDEKFRERFRGAIEDFIEWGIL